MNWLVTFYSGSNELFDVDILRNDINDGQSRVCSEMACEGINTQTVRLTRYTNVLSPGQIAGIVIGVVGLVVVIVLLTVFMCRRQSMMEGERIAAEAER